MSMLEETIRLLNETKGSIPRRRIAEETGLGYEWINKLAQGHIADPGFIKVSRLHAYLIGQRGSTNAAA